MSKLSHVLAPLVACVAIASLCGGAYAAPAEIVESSATFGSLSLPFTTGFSQSLMPPSEGHTSDDFFLSDYGFTMDGAGSFSSALITFDLGGVLQLADVTLSLLQGKPWSGPVPAELSAAQVADRNARLLEASTGSITAQTLDPRLLVAGDYTLEVRGRITGSAGGSFGGVLNVANVSAVPEPSGLLMALAGAVLLGATAKRSKR